MIRSISPQKIAFWQARLDAQAQSGLTIAEFCKQQKYSASAFYQWRRKLQNIGDSASSNAPAMIEIHLRSGSLIRLPSSNTELLQAAIESLRAEI